ncbi:DNA-binding protein [Didymella exigua CBS 183.55]|uniref:DNA-binding protein n=1 Tax=Didymella exigua CBS 183.55 TaxID=1150837 RepID=A0A6A5RB82_9PLEO|nr:DNA-binding protein [Didymella exigua CBS 183.55]KAF1923926.1 DNA-binding protein [Didymella exigua CBS 183.55]
MALHQLRRDICALQLFAAGDHCHPHCGSNICCSPSMAGATYTETLEAFTNFLTAYIHTLLYLRSLYPRTSFVHSRFHNTSTYQSRHPLVCEWIRDAIDAVKTELLDGTVSRIGIVIFHYGNGSKTESAGGESKGTGNVQIMERFMIDVSTFPMVNKEERNAIIEWGARPSSQASLRREDSEPNEPAFDIGVDTNLAEQMRGALISLTTRCAQLKPLPDKCSFNIAMELKDEADIDPPIEHPQAWIPVQPSLQKTGRKAMRHTGVDGEEGEGSTQESKELEDKRNRGEDLGGLRFTPIRTVETGTFRFETWVEEGRAKFEDLDDETSESAKVSFGKPKVPATSKENTKASFSTSSGDSIMK